MPQDSQSPFGRPPTISLPPSSTKTTVPHLRLVVSNTAPAPKEVISTPSPIPTPSFTIDVRKRGADLYEAHIQDYFHGFECNLILEIEKKNDKNSVICHFSYRLNESNQFLGDDDTLYGTIMVQFQIKVLNQVFLFCKNHKSSQLILYMDHDQAEEFGILQSFFTYCDDTWVKNDKQTRMLLTTDRNTLDKWRKFMKKTSLILEQSLWRQQRFNPAIRSYLQIYTRVWGGG